MSRIEQIADMYWIGYGPKAFDGYDCLGYLGNSDRNYVTDAWVEAGAESLGWSDAELLTWMSSRWGRWALDNCPMTAEGMQNQMNSCPIQEMMDEEYAGLLEEE